MLEVLEEKTSAAIVNTNDLQRKLNNLRSYTSRYKTILKKDPHNSSAQEKN